MKFFESRIPKIVLLSVSYNIYSGINKEKCSRIQEYLRLRTRQIHIKEVPWGIFLISLFFFNYFSRRIDDSFSPNFPAWDNQPRNPPNVSLF